MEPLRLVIYDATDTGSIAATDLHDPPRGTYRTSQGFSEIWRLGAAMHRRLRPGVRTLAATSWREALRWGVDRAQEYSAPIAEVQVWGRGDWGVMYLGGQRLDVDATRWAGALDAPLDALRDALAPGALMWLRCSSAFGTDQGHRFAATLAERLRARVAGHTHSIYAWQSGTRSLRPGEAPSWSEEEGIDRRIPSQPYAMHSARTLPRTISFLTLALPDGW